MEVVGILGDRDRPQREADLAQALLVDLERHVEVLDHQARGVDVYGRKHGRTVDAGEARHDRRRVQVPGRLAELQQALAHRVDPHPVAGQEVPHGREHPAGVGPDAARDRDHLRGVEQRQRRGEVARLDPGVGVEEHDHRESLHQLEALDRVAQRARLADVPPGRNRLHPAAQRDLEGIVARSVGHDMDVLARDQFRYRPDAVRDHGGLIVRRDEDGDVIHGQVALAGAPTCGVIAERHDVLRIAQAPPGAVPAPDHLVDEASQADASPDEEVRAEDEKGQCPPRDHDAPRGAGAAAPGATGSTWCSTDHVPGSW